MAALLVHPDCSFDLYPWDDDVEGLPGIVESLEPRLKRRDDGWWTFEGR